MEAEKDRSGNLVMKKNNTSVLQYNTALSVLPHGVDAAYRCNGYIHPVWSPVGNVLTTGKTNYWIEEYK